MEYLPNDVILIVYRMLHNDLVNRLNYEYCYRTICHRNSVYLNNVYFTIIEGFDFKYSYFNYRTYCSKKIHNIKKYNVALLPQKYWYSSGCNRIDGYQYQDFAKWVTSQS